MFGLCIIRYHLHRLFQSETLEILEIGRGIFVSTGVLKGWFAKNIYSGKTRRQRLEDRCRPKIKRPVDL